MDIFLKVTSLLFFVIWLGYWFVTEKKADREKQKTKKQPPLFAKIRMSRYALWSVGVLLFLQLVLGVEIPMANNLAVELLGFCIVILGLGIAIAGRYQLGANWANAWEYQIKQKQELVTTGIYSYIRHPIYVGVPLAIIGAELVAQSYLGVFFLVFFGGAYKQAKREDILLEQYFGKQYIAYKKRTKMLIPFLF